MWNKNARLIFLISRNVYRTALRERMMCGFLLLALLFILMANVPFVMDNPEVFEGQAPVTSAIQIGFASINMFTLLIAVFVSVVTMQSCLSPERLLLLLSKPIQRGHVLAGVALGLFKMVFLNWYLMTAGLWLVVLSQTKTAMLHIWGGMSPVLLLGLLYISLVVFFFVMIPNVIAGVLALLVVVSGFGVPLAREAFAASSDASLLGRMLRMGLDCLPQVNALLGLSMQELGLFDLKIDAASVLAHTVGIIVLLNLFSYWKFSRSSGD